MSENKSAEYSDKLDRRKFVSLVGATGVAALAGCGGSSSGSDGSDGANGTSGSGDQVADVTHVGYTNQVPTQIQYNPSNPTSYAQISQYLLFDRFANFNFSRGGFVPYLIQDWGLQNDQNRFVLTLREGVTWEDGDSVTAADVATQLRLSMLSGGAIARYTDDIITEDEQTVVLNLSTQVNPRIIEFNVLGQRFMTQKQEIFQKYVDKFDGDEEAAAKQLRSFKYTDVVASGPFTLEEQANQQLLLSRRDDHPDSENINFQNYSFRYLDGNTAVHQAIGAMNVDSVFSVFAPPNVVESFSDAVQMETVPSKWGYGLVPNHNHEHAGDRAVRQAIAHVLDRKTIVQNVGHTLKKVPPIPVGIPSDDQKRWLEDAYSDFEDYGPESMQTEKAAQILREAGYSKQNGTWVDSDGTAVKLPVTVPSGWSDWITATQTIVDQFNEFGFDASVDSRNFSSLLGTAWPNSDFVLSAGGWLPGGGRAAFPYFSLQHQLIENFRGFTYNYGPAASSRGGTQSDVTVPSRTGSGSMTTNPNERLTTLSETVDEQKTRDIIVEQAWVTNVDLPMIPVMEKQEQTFLTTDQWDVPEQNAVVSQVRWACTWLPRQGELKYSG